MTHDHDTARLSGYLDGDLTPGERAELEAHLAECEQCASILDELTDVVSAAANAPDLPPERDLWPGIEARLSPRGEAGPDRDDVVALHARRRVVMTVPQLLAAGIALILFSASAVWMAVGATGPVGSEPVLLSPAVPATTVAFTDFDSAITQLEQEYLGRRDELDPTTIQVVERNLAIIDQAIREAREALRTDPSSEFVSSHLANAMRQKMSLLRQAAALAQTET